MRLGIARSLCELDPELRGTLKRAGLLTRDAREKESQEVRPEEGPQGAAVLQAVVAGRDGAGPLRHRWRPRGCQRGADRRAGAGPRARRRPRPARPDLRGRPRHPPLGPAAPGRLLGRAWPPRGPTWSTSACCPRPASPRVAGGASVPGAVISASHNPFGDNGIKLLQPAGDEAAHRRRGRDRARARRASLADPDRPPRRPTGHGVGRDHRSTRDAAAHYEAHLVGTHRGPAPRRAARSCVDCANGAASAIAPRCSAELGAHGHRAARRARRRQHQRQVRLDRPDRAGRGRGASTRPTSGSPSTATPTGSSRSTTPAPSSTVTCCSRCSPRTWPSAGRLAGNTVAVTVMTNLGFRLAMEARGIAVRETDVGRPPRPGRARRRRPEPRRRAVGPHHLPLAVDDRRRHPDRARAGRPGRARRAARWPSSRPGWSSGCPSASSTCRSPSPSAWPTAPRSGRRWSRPRPSSATTGRVLLRAERHRAAGAGHGRGAIEAQADAVAAELAAVVEAGARGSVGASRRSQVAR